jgi:hypothetical protein
MNTTAEMAASSALVAGPARETSTPWLRGLRNRVVFTGTGLAQPKTPAPASDRSAGTISVPTGSTCTMGFRLSRPARFAVSSPNALATHPWDTSCRMIDGTMTQKMMSSCSVMWWERYRATKTMAPAITHRVRLVR